MLFEALELEGPLVIVPGRISDERGYFSETFRAEKFTEHAGDLAFVQENQSLSVLQGTIRGLHFQTEPFAQGKLVRCLAGAIFDVAVDIRHGSPTFGRWVAVELTPEIGNQLWVPPGFAHGFCTLQPDTIVAYKVTHYYDRESDKGAFWNDKDIGIEWPTVADPDTLSAKDRIQPGLSELPNYFTYKG